MIEFCLGVDHPGKPQDEGGESGSGQHEQGCRKLMHEIALITAHQGSAVADDAMKDGIGGDISRQKYRP